VPPRPCVLLVSHDADEHGLAVALHLASLGVEPVLLDLSRLPASGLTVRLGAGRAASFEVGAGRRRVDPAAAVAIWWRRPRRPEAPEAFDAGQRRLFEGEWRHAIDGLVQAAPGFWVNDPARDEAARMKLLQLEAARRAGLPVPPTLVTSSLAEARRFLAGCRRGAIVKSLSSLKEGGLTRRTGPRDPALGARLAAGPAILQERVDGLDVRVIAVGRRLFAVATDARAGGNPDDVRADWWRAVASSRPIELPAELARRLLALQRRLGLAYGAIDLRRRRDGRWAFLETNPAGQWLQFEAATGLPITAALAALLAHGGKDRARPIHSQA
jgi:glutathione synthase/RimK-type ligase-like ATP-grasp enzyme